MLNCFSTHKDEQQKPDGMVLAGLANGKLAIYSFMRLQMVRGKSLTWEGNNARDREIFDMEGCLLQGLLTTEVRWDGSGRVGQWQADYLQLMHLQMVRRKALIWKDFNC